MSDGTTLGPVEIAVIGFPENKFTGEVAPALAELVESGTVSILDLVFITKDEDGSVTGIELSELDADIAAPYQDLDGEAGGLLTDEDFEQVGEALDPNSSALAIVWENAWARKFIAAVRNAGGELIAHDRIDSATVQAALAED
jgi:uncharacterized membrane protein